MPPLPNDPLAQEHAEADALRDKLAGLRTQAQTVSSQVQIDEEFLARQQSALKAAGQQLRRAQEEFDAEIQRNPNRAGCR